MHSPKWLSTHAGTPVANAAVAYYDYYDRGLPPKIAPFAAFSESEIQGLAQRAVERRFAPDEMLCREGELVHRSF